jgi:hypothetical protein
VKSGVLWSLIDYFYRGKTKGETRFRRVLFLNRMEVQKNGTLEVNLPDTVTEHPMPSGSSDV